MSPGDQAWVGSSCVFLPGWGKVVQAQRAEILRWAGVGSLSGCHLPGSLPSDWRGEEGRKPWQTLESVCLSSSSLPKSVRVLTGEFSRPTGKLTLQAEYHRK